MKSKKLKFLKGVLKVRFGGLCVMYYLGFQQKTFMAFFTSAVGILQTLVIALGAGLGIWGVINLLEGYGNDNPGANAHVR